MTLLIWPVSGKYKLKCLCCFYRELTEHREVPLHKTMSLEMLELLVQKALMEAKGGCDFAFQGGETMLAGLDFYRSLIMFQKKYNIGNIKIFNTIQTNGTLITAEWVEFF